VPTITALREDRRGGVALELDGAPWRTVPVAVAARAGLVEGRTLDRPALRTLRRELRRAEALALAGRALRARDLPRARLAARLERAAVAPAAAEASLRALEDVGAVDDDRFARARAVSLAERGYGDAAIRHDLESQGVARDVVDAALEPLEPEIERVRPIVERRGASARTARFLAGKGFSQESCEAALGPGFCN
jgi:SOS response regulatory protein OraA/RecX